MLMLVACTSRLQRCAAPIGSYPVFMFSNLVTDEHTLRHSDVLSPSKGPGYCLLLLHVRLSQTVIIRNVYRLSVLCLNVLN